MKNSTKRNIVFGIVGIVLVVLIIKANFRDKEVVYGPSPAPIVIEGTTK